MILAFVVTAGAILVVLTVRLWWGRCGRLPAIMRPGRLAMLALCLAGLYLMISQSLSLSVLYGQREWPTVTGLAVRSEIVGERAISPRLTYEYEVDGQSFEGESDLEAPMFGGKRKKYDVAHELSSQYQPGTELQVYYSPEDPSVSTITPWPTWDVYGKLGLGVVIFVGGLLGVTLPGRNRPVTGE